MKTYPDFYINGEWVSPVKPETLDIVNPATEQPFAQISVGSNADVDAAVAAARTAFVDYSDWSVQQRTDLLENILDVYQRRIGEIGDAIMSEMGAPRYLAHGAQSVTGINHLKSAIKSLNTFEFEREMDGKIIRHEPIGVCGMITPWNWPINQIASKVSPAIAAGCTMILKPSEIAPISAIVFADILHEAGVPAGVFNLINGYGVTVGEAMSAHPGIDMMSFTGSTRGGIAVAKAAADSVKRVGQELGGKSANVILEDADIAAAVDKGVHFMMNNSGQSCNAPTRMLVPHSKMQVAIEAAEKAANSVVPGDPESEGVEIGPVISDTQYQKIQKLIQSGIDEKANLVVGGLGKPDGLESGYYVKPTVFANVTSEMQIAREEIFGPVLAIMGYEDEADAIDIANDSEYGLAAYVCSENQKNATRVAGKLRAGQVHINYKTGDTDTPFGGYKQSGNGREKGLWGLQEFLEVKAITGLDN
ncbi:MAG: aldehyde dehydrogenase family protein [Acidiferrobacterales bacterium]|nr:aldehyde dehydrogenase family protein [Acidiferrobacterales bacterium]